MNRLKQFAIVILWYIRSLPSRTWFIVTAFTLFYLFLVGLVDVVMSAYMGPVVGHVASVFAGISLFPAWLASLAVQGPPR